MSIRKKLTLLLLAIGLAPTLLVSTIAYITISNELISKTVEQLVSTASKQAQKINGLLQERQEEATKLTNRFDLQSSLGQYQASATADNREAIRRILLDRKVVDPDLQSVTVAALDGTIIISTLNDQEGKKAQRVQIPASQETAATIREDSRDGVNKLYITTKVSINKQASAYLDLVFRIDDILATVQDYTGLGATGETIVVQRDANGNAVSLFPLRFDTDAALQTQLNSLQLLTKANSTYGGVADYRDSNVLVAAQSISFANWVVATKMDESEALAPILQLRDALIAIVLATSLAIILIAMYFSRFFTDPILQIARVSKRIGAGDFSASIRLTRNDEIGALGDSINTMGQSLKDFVASIESQRNRLEIILNSTTEAILAIDQAGTIIIANQATAELTKRSVDDIVTKNIADIFTWSHESVPFSIQYNTTGTHVYSDLQYADHAGLTHYVKLIVAEVSGVEEKQSARTIVTIHDETKSRELENMKIDFVSMAAHELRTPLASLRGYLELISYKEGADVNPEIKSYIYQALKSSNELGGLINNLLDVTRIERGTLTLKMTKVDLAALVRQAVDEARFNTKDKQLKLSFTGPTKPCWIVADAIAVREVVNNLLTNAIKYTPVAGEIAVLLEERAKDFACSVKDTGIGIPKRAIPNLFTKFYRVHGGLDSGSTGTGLGLFISKSIIDRHHGTIGVESTEGVSSTFTFTLPHFDQAAFDAQQAPASIETIRRHRGWITKGSTG